MGSCIVNVELANRSYAWRTGPCKTVVKLMGFGDFPGNSLSFLRAVVWSLVEELRSNKLRGVAKNSTMLSIRKNHLKNNGSFWFYFGFLIELEALPVPLSSMIFLPRKKPFSWTSTGNFAPKKFSFCEWYFCRLTITWNDQYHQIY